MTNIELMKNYLLGYVKDFIKEYYKCDEQITATMNDGCVYIKYYRDDVEKGIFKLQCRVNFFGEHVVWIQPNFSTAMVIIPVDKCPYIGTPIAYISLQEPSDAFVKFDIEDDMHLIPLCRYITFRMYKDNILSTYIDKIGKQPYEKQDVRFTTTEVFNPDYWHVGDAVEFTRKGKVGDTFKEFTGQALITKINYNIIDIEYIDGIRVGMTITFDDVKGGKVKIRKLN